MAIAYVGDAAFKGTTGSSSITYTSHTGNLLVATGLWFDSTGTNTGITRLVDSAGNTWHYSASDASNPPAVHEVNAGQTLGTFAAWTFQDVGTITSVGLDFPGSVFQNWDLSEFSGVLAFDTSTTGSGTTAGANLTTPAVTLSATGDLVLTALHSNSAASVPLPSGASVFPNDVTPANYKVYEVVSPSGSFAFTYTGFGASNDWVASIAAFTAVVTGTNAPAGNAPGTGVPPAPGSSVRIGMTIRGS